MNPTRMGSLTAALGYKPTPTCGGLFGTSSWTGADAWSSLTTWRDSVEATRGTFGRNALQMVWDFAEANPFSSQCGNWCDACVSWIERALRSWMVAHGGIQRADAATLHVDGTSIFSTDPPYYDNVAYADLIGLLLRLAAPWLGDVCIQDFATSGARKERELVAEPARHGGPSSAEEFFMAGMSRAVRAWHSRTTEDVPVAIYYAFKQAEIEQKVVASTGWATFLEAVIDAGFQVDGTWPMRTELRHACGTSAVTPSHPRSSSSAASGGRSAERDAGRVPAGAAGGAAGGAAHAAGERDRAGRHGPGLDRPRHGRVLALQGGAGGGRHAHVGARGAAHHQRRARRVSRPRRRATTTAGPASPSPGSSSTSSTPAGTARPRRSPRRATSRSRAWSRPASWRPRPARCGC